MFVSSGMNKGLIENLSFDFSSQIIKTYILIVRTHKEYAISKQLLRSATSIGANIVEAESAISRKEFLSKLYIALKEAKETMYWIELIINTKIYESMDFTELKERCNLIISVLTKIIKSTKSNLQTTS